MGKKRVVIVSASLLVFFFILPFVAAPRQELPAVANVRPIVTIEFDEAVVVKSAEFLSENTSLATNGSAEMVNASIIRFAPFRALANGAYTFTAIVADLVGNIQTHQERFIVTVPNTEIMLVQPRLGYAQQQIFPIVIQTTFVGVPEPTQCKYMLADPLFNFFNFGLLPFDSGGMQSEHRKEGFSGPNADFILPSPLYVVCTDSRDRANQEQFNLFVDTQDPVIEGMVLDPNTINERNAAGLFETLLTIEASEPVICKYSLTSSPYDQMTPFSSYRIDDLAAFQVMGNQSMTAFSPTAHTADYTLAVGCEDRSGRRTAIQTIPVRVDMNEALTISVLAPPQFPTENSIELRVRTNRQAHCLYAKAPESPTTMMTPGAEQPAAKQHSASLVRLEEGEQSYRVLCSSTSSGVQQIAEQSVAFIVDRTPPSRPEISGPTITCQQTGFVFPDEQELTFAANDSSSGVSHYLFSLKLGSQILINESRSGDSLSSITAQDNGQPLNLSPRQGYTLSVKAVDNAGKQSTASTLTLKYDPTLPVCRERNPPTVTLAKSTTPQGTNVTVLCRDDTACDNSSILVDTDSSQQNCKPSARLFPPFSQMVYSTSFFCYNVSDINGNSVSGGEFITAMGNQTNQSACTNRIKDGNEADVDCGGDCVPCEEGRRCNTDEQCQSGFCQNGQCAQSSCIDGMQNGEEKGTDCGGNCPTGCDLGTTCIFNAECLTNYCDPTTRICAEASCSDAVKNGQETGKDCGGSCDPCAEGESCKEDQDCVSGTCSFGFCTGGRGTSKKDTDGDGIPDEEELALGLDPNDPADADADPDEDGLTNLQEIRYRTDIHNADSDGDGFLDGAEIEAGTDPLDAKDMPESKGFGIVRFLPLIIGILLIFYGLWAIAYTRYVTPPKRIPPPIIPTAPERTPTVQPRIIQAREQRLAETQRKMKDAAQSKLRERLKIFDLFGGGKTADKPAEKAAEDETPPARVLAQLPKPPPVEERAGWITLGKKQDRADETFSALERLGRKVPVHKAGLSDLRRIRTKKGRR